MGWGGIWGERVCLRNSWGGGGLGRGIAYVGSVLWVGYMGYVGSTCGRLHLWGGGGCKRGWSVRWGTWGSTWGEGCTLGEIYVGCTWGVRVWGYLGSGCVGWGTGEGYVCVWGGGRVGVGGYMRGTLDGVYGVVCEERGTGTGQLNYELI